MDPVFIQTLPTLLYAIFLGASALTVFLGALLTYHWYRYAMNPGVATLAVCVYAGVSGTLILGLLGATFFITATL